MTTYFYARVSTRGQDAKSQEEAALARGIKAEYMRREVASGARHERPVLKELLAEMKSGDTLVCFKLDRLGRSLTHLLRVLDDLEARGIAFETLDGVSTKGSTGKLVLHILGSVAQFERTLLIERTLAGLAVARAEGKVAGPKRKMSPQDLVAARKHLDSGLKAHQVAAMYGCSERSLWRNLRWVSELEEVRNGQ